MARASPEELLKALDGPGVHFISDSARRRLAAAAQAEADWSLVKQTPSRSVYRCQPGAGAGVLYLKHFHSPALVHRLQRRLGWCDAMCEMRFSRYLLGNGVPALHVLAACCRNGQAWLVSEGIEPSVPADRWHADALGRGQHAAIRGATLALAELVGRMHAGGVIHRDLHGGNILVRDGEPESLVLMDLHRMRRRRWLSRHSRAANLAQLLHDRRLWTTRSQRLRFCRAYLRASRGEGTLRGWVQMIEPLARRHTRRVYAQRDRRTFGNSRYFARLNPAGYRAHVVLASKRSVPGSRAAAMTFTAADWAEALADPEALFTGPGAEVIKDSPSSLVVRRTLHVGPHAIDVYVKRARRKRAVRWLVDLFRHSRALRGFHHGHALLARRIHNALPLAAMEKRRGRFLLDSVLITEAVGQGVHLNRFLTRYLGADGENGSLPPSRRSRLARQVLWQLGRLLRRLHEEGFAHRDLKASNLLVHWAGEPERAPEIVMVDLDGVDRLRRVSARRQFRGLMRLNVSLLDCPAVNRAGRLRMLLGYLRRPGVGPIDFKPYWRELERWSDRKIRRQIRSRRRRQRVQRRNRP